MGNMCKGICELFKADSNPGNTRYKNGQKRCTLCDQFLLTNNSRCPCCKTKLRTRPRSKRIWNQL